MHDARIQPHSRTAPPARTTLRLWTILVAIVVLQALVVAGFRLVRPDLAATLGW